MAQKFAPTQRFIRSVIRQVWNSCPAGAVTFREALNACQTGHWQDTSTGWTVTSSSGAGYTTSFNTTEAMTPTDWQELFEYILENYKKVIDSGISEDEGEPDAMDSNFVAALNSYFTTIKGYVNNYAYGAV